MDDVGDHSPDCHIAALADLDGLEVGVFSLQKDGSLGLAEPFHREIAIDHGDYDLPIGGRKGPVHHKDVTGVDACGNF